MTKFFAIDAARAIARFTVIAFAFLNGPQAAVRPPAPWGDESVSRTSALWILHAR